MGTPAPQPQSQTELDALVATLLSEIVDTCARSEEANYVVTRLHARLVTHYFVKESIG